jgi:hypothetical protein
MIAIIILAMFLLALAVLAPLYGVDSRDIGREERP